MSAGTLSLRRLAALFAALMLMMALAVTPVAAGDDDDDDNGDNGDNGGVPDTAMSLGADPNLALTALGAASLVSAAGIRYVLRRDS